MKKLRTIIVAGLLVWIPLGLTIFVIKLLIDLLGQTYLLIPPALRPENLIGTEIPGIGVIVAYFVILHINMATGVLINVIADSISIPYFIRTRAWDLVIMLTFLLSISVSKLVL